MWHVTNHIAFGLSYIKNIILHAPTQCKCHACQVELVMSNMIEMGNQLSHVNDILMGIQGQKWTKIVPLYHCGQVAWSH